MGVINVYGGWARFNAGYWVFNVLGWAVSEAVLSLYTNKIGPLIINVKFSSISEVVFFVGIFGH